MTNNWNPGDAQTGQEELELQLDLLVDGELTEEERRTVLRRMEELGAHAVVGWKELALRFLERQVEKETVGQLMAGGRLVPVEFVPAMRQRIRWQRLFSSTPMAIAAGLMIAVTSAGITFYTVRRNPPQKPGTLVFDAQLPPESVGGAEGVAVRVPVVATSGGDEGLRLLPVTENEGGPAVAQRSLVIQPDQNGRPVAIPVNTMMMQVH